MNESAVCSITFTHIHQGHSLGKAYTYYTNWPDWSAD